MELTSILYNLFLHGLMIGSMILFAGSLLVIALQAPSRTERLKRILALFAGAMIVIGAQASGLSFATFAADALGTGRATSAGATAVTALIPGLAGMGMGYFLVRTYRRNDVMAMRLICLVGMLALAAFVQAYATITHTEGVLIGATAVPNISFAAGIIMVFVFTDDKARSSRSLMEDVGGVMSRFRRPGTESDAAANPTRVRATPKVKDPFDI